jgi:hypothetical protein
MTPRRTSRPFAFSSSRLPASTNSLLGAFAPAVATHSHQLTPARRLPRHLGAHGAVLERSPLRVLRETRGVEHTRIDSAKFIRCS